MADEENNSLDFDQFWAEHIEKPGNEVRKRVKILGDYYELVVDIPFSLMVETMNTDSNDLVGMSKLADQIYGEGVLGIWLSKGLSIQQLPIIMAWSIARIQGRDLSFEEVANQLKDFMGGKVPTMSGNTGPPLNRVTKRAMDKAQKRSSK